MTTKQYIKQHLVGDEFNTEKFIDTFGNEFVNRLNNMVEYNKSIEADVTFSKFQHLIKEMDNKFKAINNKLPGEGMPEQIFGAFFSKYVIPHRAKLFPLEHQEISQKREQYKQKEETT